MDVNERSFKIKPFQIPDAEKYDFVWDDIKTDPNRFQQFRILSEILNRNNHYSFFMFDFQKDSGLEVVRELVEGDSNLSRIYGFILYTDSNPYLIKVLRDNDFWNALDSISGSNWPIFSARPLQQGQMEVKGADTGYTGFMVQTWKEPSKNIPILKDFGLEDSQDLPLFVVFMWDDDDNLNEVAISIQGNDIDSVYHSLEEIVKAIAKVEDAVLPEYKGTVNVFRNVKSELESLRLKHKIIKRGKILKRIADFLAVFV